MLSYRALLSQIRRRAAVDITGLPLAAAVLPASTHENVTTEMLLGVLNEQGQAKRLQLVLVDRGVTIRAAKSLSKRAALEVRRVGHDKGRHTFVPLAYAWRVEVAHGHLLRSRRLARSFECTPESASGWLLVTRLVGCPHRSTQGGCRRYFRLTNQAENPQAGWVEPTLLCRIVRRFAPGASRNERCGRTSQPADYRRCRRTR